MTDLATKTLKSASTQTIVTVVTAVLTLVTFSILSRLLSKEDFGYYAIITAISTVFMTLTEAGMGSAVIQRHNFTKSYFDTAFNLALYLGLFFSVLLIIGAKPISDLVADNDITRPLRLMAISILFCSLNSVAKAHMTRKLQFKRIGIYTIAAYIVSSVVAIIMAASGCGVYSVVAQAVLNALFTFMIFYFFLDERPKWFFIQKRHIHDIVYYSGWLTASSILRTIYQQLDKFCMSVWYPVTVLGAYNRPSGFITQVSTNINGIFDTILFPILSSIQSDTEKVKKAFSRLIYMLNLYSSVLCIGFIFSSKVIITIFFGDGWDDIINVFNILSLILLVSINGRIMDCFIRSLAYVKMGFYMRVVACIITLCCLFAGKDYGLVGIAIAMVATHTLVAIMKLWYICHKIGQRMSDTFINMLKAYRIIIIPLCFCIAFYSHIVSDFLYSLIATISLALYFIFALFCIPGVLGDELERILYSKFPRLKSLLIHI